MEFSNVSIIAATFAPAHGGRRSSSFETDILSYHRKVLRFNENVYRISRTFSS